MAYSSKYAKKADDKPFVDIVCKNITYDCEAYSNYNILHNMAVEEIRNQYNDNKREEEEEINAMIESGEINSADEYDRAYEGDFSAETYKKQIDERVNRYFCNVEDLPKDVVVTVDKAKAQDENVLKAMIKETYGYAVKSIEHCGEAKTTDILQQKTFNAISDMYNSPTYQKHLQLTSNMNGYSLNNTALVIAQNPQAEAVKGYHSWKEFDRNVGAGQKGSAIWCPNTKTLSTEKQVDAYLKQHSNEFGVQGDAKYDAEKTRLMDAISRNGKATIMNGYSQKYVWDIKQTVPLDEKHDNLEELLNAIRLQKPLKQSMENCDDVVASLEATMNLEKGKLTLDPNLSQQENLYQFIERYAEEVLSTRPESIIGIKSNVPSQGAIHDIEVKMSAYLAATHIGIECDEKASLEMGKVMKDKLSDQSIHLGRREIFSQAYARAVCFSKQFDKQFDMAFEPYKQKQTVKEMQEVQEMVENTLDNIAQTMKEKGIKVPDTKLSEVPTVDMMKKTEVKWTPYIIEDLKTWSDPKPNVKQSALERFSSFEEAKARFDELRRQPYNQETDTSYARLTLGMESSDGRGAIDVLHVRNGQNYLVEDFTRTPSILSNPSAMELISNTASEIGFDRIITYKKLENGSYDNGTDIPFSEWDNHYFEIAQPVDVDKIMDNLKENVINVMKERGEDISALVEEQDKPNPHLSVPVITYDRQTANKLDNVSLWRESQQENRQCAADIAAELNAHSVQYNTDVDKVADIILSTYPPERVELVLAHEVIPTQDYLDTPQFVDGRYSMDVQKWAKDIIKDNAISKDAFENFSYCDIHDKSHPIIVNALIKTVADRLNDRIQDKTAAHDKEDKKVQFGKDDI